MFVRYACNDRSGEGTSDRAVETVPCSPSGATHDRVRAIDTGILMTKIRNRVKQLGAFALAVGVVATSSVVFAPAAGALEGEPIVYDARPGSKFNRTYQIPIPANDPAGLFHEPGACATATSCMEIPLKIQLPPGFDFETGDFVINVTLSWNLAGSPDENAVNDLDMYIYDMAKLDPETGEEAPGVAGQSATGSMPEVAKLFSPSDKKDYRILVSNFAGPNSGFTLDLEYKDFSFVPPDEGDGTPAGGPTGSRDEPAIEDPGEPASSDEDFALEDSDGSEVAAGPLGGGETPALTLPDADEDFSDGFSLPSGGAAGSGAPSLFAEDEGPVEAGPVAGTVLAAWLGVAPLALLAGVIAFILKRRPPALSMAFPTGGVRMDQPADA